MKLRDLLILIHKTAISNDINSVFITGGTPRDKILNLIKPNELNDLDITTGDKTIHNLAVEVELELKKHYNIKTTQGDDGHRSIIFPGNKFKLDFSSNFILPNIDELLYHLGIKNPTNMQREMFSRDFTCNALLMTLDLKTIKDPIHLGLKDIKKKVLTTCLDPNITLRYNTNRIIRTIYLSAKLDFDVDPKITEWISKNKELVRLSSDKYLIKNVDKAMNKNPERAIDLINKMNLWDYLPITDKLKPHMKRKTAQFFRRNLDYNELDEKYSYNEKLEQGWEGNPNGWMPENNPIFQEDPYPFNQYYPPGEIVDKEHYYTDRSDKQPDDDELDDIKERRLKRLKRIKRMQKLKEMKGKNEPILEPTPFYSSLYGYTGFEGAMTSPLEYYSGGIMDEPGAITNNPYNDTYQGNSFSIASKNERILIRAMILRDVIGKP
jgi:tRNA nucleotidyltransferase/poly(A) polymerase